jgi:succinate-semialdehyde dehydrogenase/glutarate-semialdehyde dehydrogenase
MGTIVSQNPYSGELLETYNLFTANQIETTLRESHLRQKMWSLNTFESRAKLFLTLANKLREQKSPLASLITSEMGKVIREAEAEVEKCAWVCEYYAQNAEEFLAPQKIETNYSNSFVAYNPLGTVLAIMPWNFPFWQVFRAAAPIIMAGNTMILKHASNVSGCALAMERLFLESGFEKYVFSTVLVKGSEASKLIDDRRIAAATITGSTPAGIAVATAAGRNLKKSVLELGGSDPYVILADADMELAVEKCAAGRLLNAGQSCIGAKRFIVVKEVYDRFVAQFLNKLSIATTGDPTSPATTYGPLANTGFRDELHQQVLDSVSKGAKTLCGGRIIVPNRPLYPPTLLVDVVPGMPAYDEELFGPVASVIKAADETEAIRIANDTMFGLGAAIFTQDIERGTYIAQNQIEAGCCFVNDFVKSDPRLPFGGIKMSGFGRELSLWGIREFTNIKAVAVK